MKQITLIIIFMTAIFSVTGQKSFHDFIVEDINGNEFDLSQLKGKKVLVVNTASKCGFTPQYEQLQKIYETYGGENFTIIGFPANNFLKQEPGSNSDIAEFCKINFGVTFPRQSYMRMWQNIKVFVFFQCCGSHMVHKNKGAN